MAALSWSTTVCLVGEDATSAQGLSERGFEMGLKTKEAHQIPCITWKPLDVAAGIICWAQLQSLAE